MLYLQKKLKKISADRCAGKNVQIVEAFELKVGTRQINPKDYI